ncbi:unnamed protein product [Owenia fusiformis]|nr:unnamed protein product [Owenia fusiformis]
MLNKRPRLDIQESSADKNPSVTTDTSVNSLPETLFSNTSRNTVTKETNEAEKLVYNKDMICDWSLKMKIRFMSPELFSWCHPLKTNEECDGLYSFVRRAQYQANTCSRKPEFQKACMYWIHPNLPWCKLFPRINADSALGKQTGLLLEDHVLKALYDDWTESFTSAFHLLRSCHSPYFYMLTHQLNVLFRAPGVGGLNKMNAIVTPTTRGFREALTEEGIEFTMPLHDTTKTDNEDDSESNSPVQNLERVDYENDLDPELIEDDDLLATDSGASSWLESMGLDKSSYPSLDPNKVKLQRESYRAIDNRPESMVLVQGPSTQALYNYLLNYKSCIAHSGSQAGVPPTILSPSAFKGATLKSLQVKQGTIRQQCQDGTMVSNQTLEVSGPILPHTTLALCSLFKQTQCSDFSGVFNVHDHSTAFNGTPLPQNAKNSRNNWGLPMDMEEVLFRSNNLGKLAVREIVCTADGYHWNT